MKLKKSQDEIEAHFQEKYADKNILMMDKYALYVAIESDGFSHFRGCGYLILTEDELYFERQLDRKLFSIPTGKIIKVEPVKRMAGQNPAGKMLRVEFKNDGGQTDAIAWKLKKLDEWIAIIEKTVHSQKSGG